MRPSRTGSRWVLTFGMLAVGAAPATAQVDAAEEAARAEFLEAKASEAQRERILEFRPWRKNYFLATQDLRDDQHDTEAKFQISVRSRLADWGGDETGAGEWSVDFAYTGHFLWRALTRDAGEPYFTADHSPEIFMQTPVIDDHWIARVSPFLHHSNGESGADSRGWNRAYLSLLWHSHVDADTPLFFFDPEVDGGWRLGLRWWVPYGLEDANEDIDEYYGNFELTADLYRNDWSRSVLSVALRDSALVSDVARTSLTVDYGFDLTEDVRLSFQYFTGYGDTLLRYDEQVQRVGVGIEIAP